MKKAAYSILPVPLFLVFGLFLLNLTVAGQETSKASPPLPDNIDAIVSVSCVPCHTSKGGFLSRGTLNFTEWTIYSQGKQKNRAEKMSYMLNKGKMPPKSVRKSRPEIVPSKEQIDIIKKWADSLKPAGQ